MPDASLDRATAAIGDLAAGVQRLTREVKHDESLRERKIKAIQRVLIVLVPSVLLLVILAITNFVLLSRIKDVAEDARNTNDLLVSCFQPGTACSKTNSQRTGEALNQIRQTQFVIAICQRQNPIASDPDGKKVIACVQNYYPTFVLPPQPAGR